MRKARDSLETIERIEDALVEMWSRKLFIRKGKQERNARTATLLDKLDELWDEVEQCPLKEEISKIECCVKGSSLRNEEMPGEKHETFGMNSISLDSYYQEINNIKKASVKDPLRNKEVNLPAIDYTRVSISSLYTFPEGSPEKYGRCIELNEEYNLFLSTTTYVKHVESHTKEGELPVTLSYIDYLTSLSRQDISCGMKIIRNKNWFEYLTSLSSKFETFITKRWPLMDEDKRRGKLRESLEERISLMRKKWIDESEEYQSLIPSLLSESKDNIVNVPDEPVSLWCGICSVHIETKGGAIRHISGKKHNYMCKKLGVEGNRVKYDSENCGLLEETSEIKFLLSCCEEEGKVLFFSKKLRLVLEETALRMEQRMTTECIGGMSRLKEDSEEEDLNIERRKDDGDKVVMLEEKKIWNPKNFPLDSEGVPIPVWLYKLRGLGVKEKCEICGDYIYQGRSAFTKHFNKERHVRNLKLLGIKYSNQFYGITSIEEAKKLNDVLKARAKKQDFVPETEPLPNNKSVNMK